MEVLKIEGGHKINGQINAQGCKNAILPILAATILNNGSSKIYNYPKISDVYFSLDILKHLGCEIFLTPEYLQINSIRLKNYDIPENLMHKMRSSIIFLGAIISRFQHAVISYPGGRELGPRPVDLHLKAFKSLGVDINESHGFIECLADKIKCRNIHLDFPSVGATENIMLISALSKGITIISNAAKEPEILDLQQFLNSMGANIRGAGTDTVKIVGVKNMHDTEYTVMPDRIAIFTYLVFAAITGGSIQIDNVNIAHINSMLSLLQECNCKIIAKDNKVILESLGRIRSLDHIRTMPYPGFPTDAQAPLIALLSIADGASIVSENIFESRFNHIEELIRMGADITVSGKTAIIRGVNSLSGAKVTAPDLRGGAALIAAGLSANGITEIAHLTHIDRGYESIKENLSKLSVKAERSQYFER